LKKRKTDEGSTGGWGEGGKRIENEDTPGDPVPVILK